MFAPASADNSRYPGFVSFKTLVPIHYPKRWMRTALIRATLAPDLIGLAPCPDDFPFTKPEIQFAFATFDAARLRFVLLTEFTLRQLGLHDHAEHFDTMNRSEVLAQPSADVARQIWMCSRVHIQPAVQVAVLRIVRESAADVYLSTILQEIGSTLEISRQVFAMIAKGFLEIDVSRPLGRDTVVKPATYESKWRKRIDSFDGKADTALSHEWIRQREWM